MILGDPIDCFCSKSLIIKDLLEVGFFSTSNILVWIYEGDFCKEFRIERHPSYSRGDPRLTTPRTEEETDTLYSTFNFCCMHCILRICKLSIVGLAISRNVLQQILNSLVLKSRDKSLMVIR